MDDFPTVFVIHEDPESADGLRRVVESAGFRFERYASVREFLPMHDPERPGCLIIAVRMPGLDGLAPLDELSIGGVMLPIIVLAAHAEVPMAVRALKDGAADFIPMPCSDGEFLDSVRRAVDEDRKNRAALAERLDVTRRVKRLTPRERQVMDLVVTGKANKQVAVELGCSCKTIEVHRSRVMEKMEAGSIAGLVRMAMLIADPDRRKKGEAMGKPLWIGRPYESMDTCSHEAAPSPTERIEGRWEDRRSGPRCHRRPRQRASPSR